MNLKSVFCSIFSCPRRRRIFNVCTIYTVVHLCSLPNSVAAKEATLEAIWPSALQGEVLADPGAEIVPSPLDALAVGGKLAGPTAARLDYSWVSGGGGPTDHPITIGPFVLELRLDTAIHYSSAQPKDDTIAGSSEAFRHGELSLTHVAFGGNLDYRNVQARLLLQLGMYSQTNARNDASVARGQWRLDDALRYMSEAYLGYHFSALRGINLQAGLFMSYIGLWSYYNFDNWTYQPSYVSSNTPWFFSGLRAQIYVTDHLKIEPWLINGWQSYGRFNYAPGIGGQIVYRPNGWLAAVANLYFGTDTPNTPSRKRFHSDNSVLIKYLDRPAGKLSKAAFTVTFDGGFEAGGGVSATDQHFLGAMAYNRLWFWRNRLGLTVGGGIMKNPGRYLVLLPPINGATAITGSPYFTENPHDPYLAWDTQATFDIMPVPYATFRFEYTYRHANVPYFTGHQGITPPGGNNGAPASLVQDWAPDLSPHESRGTVALMIKI